jgi:PIN domain nuclease of toxin-antitoxin system
VTSVVMDASAVLALVRDEPGADKVTPYVGRAAISAVNLQEVIKELLLSGLDAATIREILAELRLMYVLTTSRQRMRPLGCTLKRRSLGAAFAIAPV